MIDLYAWTTPNGRKISIALEEMGLPYTVHPINIGNDEQFSPDFLAISPNNKIPAIVDQENGVSVFESGAILTYLAEKSGKFLPDPPKERDLKVRFQRLHLGRYGGLGLSQRFGGLGHTSFINHGQEHTQAAQQRLILDCAFRSHDAIS